MKKNIIFAIFILLFGACKEKEISKPTEFEVTVTDENKKPIPDFEFNLSMSWPDIRVFGNPGRSANGIALAFKTNANGIGFSSTQNQKGQEANLIIKNNYLDKRKYFIKPFNTETIDGKIKINITQIKFKELNKIEIIRLKE